MGRGKHILQKRTVRKIRGTAGFDYNGVGPEHPIGSFKKKRIPLHESGNKGTLQGNMLLLLPNNK